ncbi:hypothetical protein C8J57DRAFT_1536118 [Mycena rebaudengoi]|nr:hypothetical protein C8J57DRAFT_1536118 [Mycena rebaudengoi]
MAIFAGTTSSAVVPLGILDDGTKLMQLGHFSASVSVDGVQLSEYAPEYSADGQEATCWIPSESGKKFKIEWSNAAASASCHISGYLGLYDLPSILLSKPKYRARAHTISYPWLKKIYSV